MTKRRATFAVAGLTLGCAVPAAPASAAPMKRDLLERSVLRKVNYARVQAGVRLLRHSRALRAAADLKAWEVVTSSVLSHRSPDGTPMLMRVRRYLRARAVGETIGYVPADVLGAATSADAIVTAWMRSPSHRSALLSRRYRRAGIARRTQWTSAGPIDIYALDLASRR